MRLERSRIVDKELHLRPYPTPDAGWTFQGNRVVIDSAIWINIRVNTVEEIQRINPEC
jgi:hypothetical protein